MWSVIIVDQVYTTNKETKLFVAVDNKYKSFVCDPTLRERSFNLYVDSMNVNYNFNLPFWIIVFHSCLLFIYLFFFSASADLSVT